MENTDLGFPACFDEVKIPKINSEKKDNLIGYLTGSSTEIWEALYKSEGMNKWFDIYLLSPEFQKLDREEQKNALLVNRSIRSVLEVIDEFLEENGLGEYNSEYYQWQADRKEQ